MVSSIKRDKRDLLGWPIIGFMFKNRLFLQTLRVGVFALFIYAIVLGFVSDTKENLFTTGLFWGLFWPFFYGPYTA